MANPHKNNLTYNQPIEEKFSVWHNPLDHDQYVDILHGTERIPRRYTIKPGEKATIPSRFDNAIHALSRDGSTIVGGLAPQLIKEGAKTKLDPVLDPRAAEKLELEAAMAAEQLRIQAAESALLRAAAAASKITDKKPSK